MSEGRITLEEAARAMLGREDEDEEKPNRGSRPPSKITLPRVAWLDRPGPQWEEPPRPARRRKGVR
jgi:hypothetical protein